MLRFLVVSLSFILIIKAANADDAPTGLVAEGFDSRVDLVWNRLSDTDEDLFNIYRARKPEGPWYRINKRPHSIHVYSDFVGNNDKTYYYRVTHLKNAKLSQLSRKHDRDVDQLDDAEESPPSEVVHATTAALDEEAFLDSVQKGFFRYFWDFGHPVSGLSREGLFHHRDTVTTGGTGFGLVAIMVGAERGFVPREAAAERLLTMVTFLEEKAERYHGLWAHHLNGRTGETIPFAGKEDNGGDIVEAAFLMQGLLAVREYFDQDSPTEKELRERITRLWEEAEWDWYQQPGDKMLTWHWSKQYGFQKNHKIRGFNECMIAYLLAMASPTHAIDPDSYYAGWVNDSEHYKNGNTYYDIQQPVGKPMGGPLFFTHYSYLVLNPHELNDAYTNYFENNRAISLINRAYCIANPRDHKGYNKIVWGLTASQGPRGYRAHEPDSDQDTGTIAPTAAISAMPYTPEESLATLQHFYHRLGRKLWGPFGFYDAFNLGEDWVSPSFLAIDQGPMIVMMENHRTGLPWKTFMKSEVGQEILKTLSEASPL